MRRRAHPAFRMIVVALLFAAAILIASYLLRGTEHGDTGTHFLIAIWFTPFSFLCAQAVRLCKSCQTCEEPTDGAGSQTIVA